MYVHAAMLIHQQKKNNDNAHEFKSKARGEFLLNQFDQEIHKTARNFLVQMKFRSINLNGFSSFLWNTEINWIECKCFSK